MADPPQPIFYTGGALRRDYPHYITRQADYTARRALQQGKLIYAIAPRQMGKTSLIKRLAAFLEDQGWLCSFLDLATFRNLDRPRWFRLVGERIAQACRLETIRSPLQDQQDFRQFLLNEVGLNWSFTPIKLAIFLDEVEGLLGLDFSDDFLMTLRDLYQQRENYPGQFLAIFAGAADPQILVKDATISPFNIADEIVLRDFDLTESLKLTEKLALTGATIQDDVYQRIYDWAEGHPYLTQRLCEIIEEWTESRALQEVSRSVVDQAVREGLLASQGRDKNIKHILSNLTNPMVSSVRIWQRLLTDEPVSATEPGFYSLYLSGLVAEADNGHVKIRNNIYRAALGIGGLKDEAAEQRPRRTNSIVHTVLNPGKTWAVLVGINAYDDPYVADLSVCAEDVTAVYQAMESDCTFARLLTDQTSVDRPTRANILGALSSVAQAVDTQDLLLFYFSGHGVADGGESYLLPQDARLSALKHTALAIRDVREILDQSPARAKVLILDACHSGAALGKAAPTMSLEFLQRVFAEAEGMAVLASCKQGQRSWEWHDQQRSVFTFYLLEALHGQADFDQKGFVTVTDASRYVTDRIKNWAAQQGVTQTPTLQCSVSGEIVLSYYTTT